MWWIGCLTGSRARTDDRRTAICLMTALALVVVSPLARAQADELAPPASLIGRALRRSDGCTAHPSERAATAAQWMPELRLGAAARHADWAAGSSTETLIYGALAWPLDRAPVGDALAVAQRTRQCAEARTSLVERIAAAWHRRLQAEALADDVAAELATEEADAELEALTDEDAP